jgi:hypothetical protein
MRNKFVVVGVMTALIGSGVVIGAMVPAASQQPGTTFTVCDRNRGGYNREIDVGRNGFSAGDGILEVDTLRRPKSGAKVGRLVVRVFRRQQDSLVVGDFTSTFRKTGRSLPTATRPSGSSRAKGPSSPSLEAPGAITTYAVSWW